MVLWLKYVLYSIHVFVNYLSWSLWMSRNHRYRKHQTAPRFIVRNPHHCESEGRAGQEVIFGKYTRNLVNTYTSIFQFGCCWIEKGWCCIGHSKHHPFRHPLEDPGRNFGMIVWAHGPVVHDPMAKRIFQDHLSGLQKKPGVLHIHLFL